MAIEGAVTDNTFAQLAAFLQYAGLGNLFSVGTDGTPGGWLWDQIVSGVDNADQLQIALEQTQEFKTRYGIIGELRQRAAAGEPVLVPTVGQVREYEDTTAKIMRQAGLPTWFYDSFTDMQDLMRKGLSPVEVEQRLGTAYERVQSTDPEIRAAFTEFYGVGQGDAALASYYLDPARTQSSLEKASRAAYTAGKGKTMGIDIDQTVAERMAALPKTEGGIYQDLTDVNKMKPLYTEGITETKDLTTGSGIEAVSFGDGEANADLQRRILERQANERSSSGGAAVTQRGVVGLKSN